MMVLGGIDTRLCSMDIFFLKLTKVTHHQKWEQIIHRSEKDKMITEVANSIIFDSKKHITQLNDLIISENLQHNKLKGEIDKQESEFTAMDTSHTKTINEHKETQASLEKEVQGILSGIENICVLMKHEEALNDLYERKTLMLEDHVKSLQNYLVLLDYLQSTLKKTKLSEKDPKEIQLKKVVTDSEETTDRTRVYFKESLVQLVKNYEFLAQNGPTVSRSIEMMKSQIVTMSPEFKKVFDDE